MPYLSLWVHVVWSTKDRAPILLQGVREEIFRHIKENGHLKNIYVDVVNGHIDHVHCLLSLKANHNIATVVRLLKGECSHWANQHRLLPGRLDWQDEYFAVSVSASAVGRVRSYILNQEEHHLAKSFQHEYDQFVKLYGFKKF